MKSRNERDVILVSITYGPNENGVFHHRFGPINGKYGPRRLNVLFSRARNRTEVFTSFEPEQLNGASSIGAQVLQRYLEFARTGELGTVAEDSGRPPDSEFEISVANVIREMGYEVTPQLGVAGYFIDIAVKDPSNPGKYLVAIECDGASYHSSKVARDRDRLRQQNLENLSWKVFRIWSTDWFKNRLREVNRLRDFLEHLSGKSTKTSLPIIYDSNQRPKLVVDVEGLRGELIRFRDLVVMKGNPSLKREVGILRQTILKEALKKLPTTNAEFHQMLKEHAFDVDDHQLAYVEQIVSIIKRHAEGRDSRRTIN